MNPDGHPCPRCGARLPRGAPEGLCPVCLLAFVRSDFNAGEAEAEAGPAELGPETPLGVSRWVGNYELLEEIGHGGMGVVFKACQRGLNRLVAVKMILGGSLSSAAAVARFRAEAELAAQLQHPGIVPIHEVGEHEGQPFFSMDYIEGRSLADLVREHPLPATAAASCLRAIAEAVQYAHEHGVLHRDLKPSNILIDAARQPRITDFGLAKRLSEDSELTLSGQVLGSPSYAAPEQVAGQRNLIGPASDVYSLGAVLYHLLVRRPPFVAETLAATVGLVREAEPVPLRRLNLSVPADLETICLKCLEKDPRRRYPTAAALAEDLERFLRSDPVLARPVGTLGRLARWCRRKPLVAGLLGGVILLALAVLIGSPVAVYRIQRERKEMERETYRASIGLAKTYIDQGSIDQAMSILTNCPPEYRHWEWGHLIYLCHKDIASFQTHGATNLGQFAELAFSLKGDLLSSVSSVGVLRLWDYPSQTEVFCSGSPTNQITCAAFDAEGKRLAAGFKTGHFQIWTVEREENPAIGVPTSNAPPASIPYPPSLLAKPPPIYHFQTALSFSAHTGRVTQVQWSCDGTQLLSAGLDGQVRLWDAGTGHLVHDLTGPTDPPPYSLTGLGFSTEQDRLLAWCNPRFLAWDRRTGAVVQKERLRVRGLLWPSPDGQHIAIMETDGRLFLGTSATNSKELIEAPLLRMTMEQPVFFSPDSQWLGNAGDNGSARIWRVEDGREHLAIPYRVRRIRFSPDSRLMATYGNDNYAVIWDLQTKQQVLRLQGHRALLADLQFSPDSHQVATIDQQGVIKLWLSETGRELLPQQDCVYAASYSPDGQWLAVAALYRGLELWNARSGERLVVFRGPLEWVSSIAFSPDGSRMVTVGSHHLIRLWEVGTWRHLASWRGHERWVAQAMYSQDGRWLLTYSCDGVIKLWEAATGRLHRSMASGLPHLFGAAISPDGQWIAAGGMDGLVKLYESATGRELAVFRGHSRPILTVAFFPDSVRFLTSATDGQTKVWDCRKRRLLAAWTARGCDWPACFSGDGRRLFAGTTRFDYPGYDTPKLVVRDAATGRELLSLETAGMCSRLQYDGARRQLLAGAFEGFVRQLEAWPWQDADYPGAPSSGLAERLHGFANHYWRQRLAAESERWRHAATPTNEPTRLTFDWEPWLFAARDARATARHINLRPFYSAPLTPAPMPVVDFDRNDEDFRNLPQGLVAFHGIDFDVRGIVLLRRWDDRGGVLQQRWDQLPREVRGIPIGQKCRRIHVLHGASLRMDEGGPIGAYICRYADGTSQTLDIRYGLDLRCYSSEGGDPKEEPERGRLAWQGKTPLSRPGLVRLYLRTYDNPRPDEEITSIDFVSRMSGSAPFLVAMTLE
jgi:WD40 repeat protein/predicted Ser/Thr protein kinase